MLPEDESALVARAVQGDQIAFGVLVAAHYDTVYRMAWRWVRSVEDAEDVAQDVFVKAGSSIRKFRGEAAFRTWLFKLAYSVSIDHLRKRQRSAKAMAEVQTTLPLLADSDSKHVYSHQKMSS